MKKFLSLIVTVITICSLFTFVVSAYNNPIYLFAGPEHVRKDNEVYYPIRFNCKDSYSYICESEGISDGSTRVVLKYSYDASTLEFVDVFISEALFNIEGTIEVLNHSVKDAYNNRNSLTVEINFDGFQGIDNEVLFNVKFNVLKEGFIVSGFIMPVFNADTYSISYSDGSIKNSIWDVTDENGNVFDLSSYTEIKRLSTDDDGHTYNELLITDYEPFIPPVCDITETTYIQQEDTHKDFTVTANGRKQMIQFIEPDGGTRTYDRYNKNVSITSYNSDGEVVNELSRDLAYEVWNIHSNMSVGVEIKVRGKENFVWDSAKYSFTIEPYNPIVSMELSADSGKKGPVPATVVADEKTEKVMFKMPNNTSVTVASTETDENGNKIFKGNAWMNEDGLNEIEVKIYRKNVWKTVGTLEYTAE